MKNSKNILCVAGDIGGARTQVPVIRELRARGHRVDIVADQQGLAKRVFDDEGLDYRVPTTLTEVCRVIKGRDLTVIGTCATAHRLERLIMHLPSSRKVLLSDGYFNHGLSVWKAVPEGVLWLAIDEGHAQAIRELRPHRDPATVAIAGQPAFDSVLAMEPHKHEIRSRVRAALGIDDDETVYLWWSQGTQKVIEEDLQFLSAALASPQAGRPVLIARLHPKLEAVRHGYLEETRESIAAQAREHGFRLLDTGGVSGEEVCLASNVILSITCTEDIKSTLIGGPPVVHFLGQRVASWFENDLQLRPPYLPDLRMKLAEAARIPEDVPAAVRSALLKNPLRTVDPEALRPATKRVVDALLGMVS